MSFQALVSETELNVKLGNTKSASNCLDALRSVAKTQTERKIVHDLGNDIQKLIFEDYLKQH